MSNSHKDALAAGRQQGAAVRSYLNALDRQMQEGSRRGPRFDPDKARARLTAIEAEEASADPLARLLLIQERLDLTARLDAVGDTGDPVDDTVDGFVANAADWAARKGITYKAFREFGVPADVLKAAGVPRRS